MAKVNADYLEEAKKNLQLSPEENAEFEKLALAFEVQLEVGKVAQKAEYNQRLGEATTRVRAATNAYGTLVLVHRKS